MMRERREAVVAPCSVCGSPTVWVCVSCVVTPAGSVYVCLTEPACRAEHVRRMHPDWIDP
jgi:hypothetical protein